MKLRRLSKRPTGFKMCVGNRVEAAAIVKALQLEFAKGHRPIDFITIDGGEGGTGAAPVEFSDRVGAPLRDGLIFVDDLLKKRILIKPVCSDVFVFDSYCARIHDL